MGILLARQCDAYIESECSGYQPRRLERTISESICCKGRLLHYYPQADNTGLQSNPFIFVLLLIFRFSIGLLIMNTDSNDPSSFSSWCGWHNDHGSITGLVSAMYMSSKGEETQNLDPISGYNFF